MRTIDQYWKVIVLFNLGLLAMSVHYGYSVFRGGSPITPELYGPAIMAVPALVWAGLQLVGSIASIFGAWLRDRRGAILLIVGSVASCALYGFFAVAASMQAEGLWLMAANLYISLPASALTLFVAIEAVRDE